MPATAALRATTMKIVNDANDVIDEITLDGGREMWTKKRWHDFTPRLKKWMLLWEELAACWSEATSASARGDTPASLTSVTAHFVTMTGRFTNRADFGETRHNGALTGLPICAQPSCARAQILQRYCGARSRLAAHSPGH